MTVSDRLTSRSGDVGRLDRVDVDEVSTEPVHSTVATLEAGDVVRHDRRAGDGRLGADARSLDGTRSARPAIARVRSRSDALTIRVRLLATSARDAGRLVRRARAPNCAIRQRRPRLRDVPVRAPDSSTQRRIAAILGAIDDLIENNRRRIALLEQMAQAIYREWFVHFRYPGHEDDELVDSPLGPIPDGLGSRRRLASVAATVRDATRRRRATETAVTLALADRRIIERRHRFRRRRANCRTTSTSRSRVRDGDVLVIGAIGATSAWSRIATDRRHRVDRLRSSSRRDRRAGRDLTLSMLAVSDARTGLDARGRIERTTVKCTQAQA